MAKRPADLPVIQVSELNELECEVAALLVDIAGKFHALSKHSRRNVMKRWEMLHVIGNATERDNFYKWIARMNDDSGADRRFQ